MNHKEWNPEIEVLLRVYKGRIGLSLAQRTANGTVRVNGGFVKMVQLDDYDAHEAETLKNLEERVADAQ